MKKLHATLLLLCISLFLNAQKTVFKPAEWFRAGTDYYGRLNDTRSFQTANFVIFWGDAVGNDPTQASPTDRRFNPKAVCDTLEKIYVRFIKELKFCSDAPTTNLGKYKIIIVMLGTFGTNGPQGFAYGGTYEGTIGAMWVDPAAVKDGGALSHELTHTLQGMISIQENKVGGGFNSGDAVGFIWEGHANYMRSLMYQRMADTDIPRWMGTRSYHWSSTRHHYANFHLLMYVQEMDGFDMTRRLWAESTRGEHPLQTLRRLKGWTQAQLNDYLYGYAKKQATFDIPIDKNSNVSSYSFGSVIRGVVNNLKTQQPRYLWKQYTILDKVAGSSDRYVVSDDWAPQDYGVNVIPLHTTCTGENKVVTVKFKGHTEVNTNFASWRYGFVTAKSDGTVSRYSPVYAGNESEISFDQQANETAMFLVVFGAPTTHTTYPWEPGYPKIKRYPYELKIANAVPEGHQSDDAFRTYIRTNGKKHSNGGGWVTNGTTIASTVYVGPKAIVRGGNYSGNVRIEGTAQVYNATMKDNVIVRGNACINGGSFSGSVIVEDNAFMEACNASGSALVKDNVFVFGVTYGGTVVMGGDSENGNCSTSGVYLQFPHNNNGRKECDGKGATDASNIDVNPTYTQFTDNQMAFSKAPTCSTMTTDLSDVSLLESQTVLFPNPFASTFDIKLSGDFEYAVYDLAGNEQEKGRSSEEIRLGHALRSGMYVVKVSQQGKSIFFKATKQ